MSERADARLRPLALYEAIYAEQPRLFAMPETADPRAWDGWRAAFRARLIERLGGFPDTSSVTEIVAERSTAQDGYRRIYLEFERAPGAIVPAWLLIPDGLSGPAPAVIAVHGHGYGVDELVGIGLDGRTRAEPEGYHQDFALALCRRGLVVLAPELRGFGRRREAQDRAEGPTISSCQQAAWWGVMLGKPLLGSRLWDVLRALDLLAARPEVDAARIGIMGGSGGGAAALLAAALDQRLRAAVISNYFCTFKDSILAIKHCHCNYVPGILQDAEMADIAALIAPRPLLIQSGDRDAIFPLSGVLAAYQRLYSAYSALDASDQLHRDVFAGGHQINGAPAYDFLTRWLEGDIT